MMLRSRGAEGWRSAFAPAVLLVLLLAAAPGGAAPSGPHPPRGPDLPIEPAVPGPWTNLSTAGGPAPPPTVGGALANDSHDLEDLWFGGSNGSGPGASGLTWIFQNGSWTNLTATLPLAPPARSFAAMAYDPEVAGVVLFGGLGDPTYLNDTWVWKDGAWTNFTAPAGRAPPARTESGMTYDLASGELLLFGGIGSSGPLADSWEFSAGRWNPLTPYASPPAACCGAMAYDPVSSAAILVLSPAGTRTLDTWSFANGNWTNLTTPSAPPARDWPTLVTDPAVGGLVLVGGSSIARPPYWPLADVWLYAGGSWTYAPGGSGSLRGPAPRWGAVAAPLVPATADGCFLLIGGGATNATPPTDGSDWMGCGNRTLWTNGSGGPGGGQVPPAVLLTADVYSGVVPFTVNLTASVTNGTAPYTLSICSSLGGCSTTSGWNGTTAIVTPLTLATAGQYLVSALVSDVNELSGSATVTILASNPGPLNATAQVGPTSGAAPLETTFRAIISGGTGPYTVQWTFGDGTTAAGAPSTGTPHEYLVPGTYHPSLVVTDSDDRSITVGLPVIDVIKPVAPTNVTHGASPYQPYLLPGSIVALGLAVAIAVYVVRRRRVEQAADATLREVTGDEGASAGPPGRPPPPEDP